KRVRYVLVFADSLSEVQANVALIRRQVLISGAIALVIAVLAGYLVARALAARVKRLEEAARKVAGGDFSNPIRADSDDELGQVERMRMLATELLDLSRLEAGALELRPEPTDVGQLARDVAAEFTPAASRHRAAVALDLNTEPLELECDPERVAQVLRILLD